MSASLERILVSLTPAESKRLIAKAVRMLDDVQNALKNGIVVISQGTTNSFVAEEILKGLPAAEGASARIERERFAAGVVTAKALCSVPKEERQKEIVIREGKVTGETLEDVLEDLSAEDVFIKGANAIDANGRAAIFLGHPSGGTIGTAIGVVLARGVNFIIPVGMEKAIPFSVEEAALRLGIGKIRKATGMPIGLMPVSGKIVTEVSAFKMLGASDAFPVGAGGVNGGEGSVVFCVEGDAEKLDKIMQIILKIKGETPVKVRVADCEKCEREKCVFFSGGAGSAGSVGSEDRGDSGASVGGGSTDRE